MDDGQPDTPIDEPQDLTPTQVTLFFDPEIFFFTNKDFFSFFTVKLCHFTIINFFYM